VDTSGTEEIHACGDFFLCEAILRMASQEDIAETGRPDALAE